MILKIRLSVVLITFVCLKDVKIQLIAYKLQDVSEERVMSVFCDVVFSVIGNKTITNF